MLVEFAGHEVHVAHDAAEALARVENTRPEVLLLDVGLPDIDGYELARRVRRLPGMADAVLVAITGYGQKEDIAAARAAGFDHHLLKPAEAAKLLALLEGVASRREAAGAH